MFKKAFWKAAAERAGKTAAQAVLLAVGAGVTAGATGQSQVNAFLLDYPTLLGFALGGAILSLLTSIGSAPVGGEGPSLTRAEEVTK